MKQLHIVSFHWPYPPINGGLMEVYYKIKWLHKIGVQVHLHAFTEQEHDLEAMAHLCASVHVYPRKTFISGVSLTLPYIVSSRISKDLLKNLQADNHPILFEGIHTTHLLHSNKLQGRAVFIRLANVEQLYYASLAKAEGHLFKKLYYRVESKLLKKYEQKLANKATILALSENDKEFYANDLQAERIVFIPAFTGFSSVKSITGSGDYILYHGNLSIPENELAVLFILEEISTETTMPIIIAGSKPSIYLQECIAKLENVELIADPNSEAMEQLIKEAHIHLLPSFNTTGVKLKLLHSAYCGRHIITNVAGVVGSGLEESVTIADDADDMFKAIESLATIPFSEVMLAERADALSKLYDNERNALALSALLP